MQLLQFDRSGSGAPLLWLHGFTQTRTSAPGFRSILAGSHTLLCPDLPGHGTASVEGASLTGTAHLLWASLADEPATLDVGGYSLGGRVALHVALADPSRVRRLVLVSATAGLADADDRRDRREHDARLADRARTLGADAFLDEWLAQPLFDGVNDPLDRSTRSRDVEGLAASLHLAGTGTQEWLVPQLPRLTMPVLLVVGERDAKFRNEAAVLADALVDATVVVIPGAGHAAHLEQPVAVAQAVHDFLAG